jgi:hypothetical protein
MSSDSERNVVFSAPPQFVPQAGAAPAVFYYPAQPLPVKLVESQNDQDAALARALQAQENALVVEEAPVNQCETRTGGCRRWGSWRRCGSKWRNVDGEKRGCCWGDDGRPLGNLSNFIQGLFFGTFAPIFSIISVYGFETSKLSRTGTLFGNANFFLILAAGIISSVTNHHLKSCGKLYAIAPLVLGLIFLLVAHKSLKWFLWTYKSRANKTESEEVKVVSQSGRCCSFISAFLASLFFSLLGLVIVLIARRRYLSSRYGAFYGFGFGLIVAGITLSFYGVPPVLLAVGLVLNQISSAHFKRAIASAEALEEKNNTTQC